MKMHNDMVFIEKNKRGQKELKITHIGKEHTNTIYTYEITEDKYKINILLQKQKLSTKDS